MPQHFITQEGGRTIATSASFTTDAERDKIMQDVTDWFKKLNADRRKIIHDTYSHGLADYHRIIRFFDNEDRKEHVWKYFIIND